MADLASPPQKMPVSRRIALEVSLGAVLGFTSWSVIGPAVISWWYEPPSRDAFSCAGSVKTALSQFVWMQLFCAVGGGVVLAAVLFTIRRSRKQPSASSGPDAKAA